jgi:hypothetical protein
MPTDRTNPTDQTRSSKQAGDELLRRVRELRERAARDDGAESGPSLDHSSASERVLSAPIGRFSAMLDAARRGLGPIGSLLAWIARLIAKWFRWAAMQPRGNDLTKRSFSVKRLILCSIVSVSALAVAHVLLAAIYYYGTSFTETVYVTGKQEIETGELYQFGGCTSLPCSTEADNGKFYLIETSLYFPVMYYPEENVFANIPQQDAACNVRGYGIYFRTLRWLYKSAQLYQHVTNVSCRPYTEDEIRRAVDDGQIVRD